MHHLNFELHVTSSYELENSALYDFNSNNNKLINKKKIKKNSLAIPSYVQN